MITPEQHAEIRRLYFGEHWKVGTIAAALGVHHDTVRAAIAHDTRTVRRGTCRASALDPYLPFIHDTLTQYPRLRATRLFEMVRPRGYTGSVVQLRRIGKTEVEMVRFPEESHNLSRSGRPDRRIERLERIVGWRSSEIREFFESYALRLHDWEKARTDRVTIVGSPVNPNDAVA